jgi:hypothetical protein
LHLWNVVEPEFLRDLGMMFVKASEALDKEKKK